MILAMVAVGFLNFLFLMKLIADGFQPGWVALYAAVVLFYAALYFRRLRHLHTGLRRGLGYAAVALGAFLSACFFYNFATGMMLTLAVGVWLWMAVAAYFLYLVIIVDGEEEEEEPQLRPAI
ncbi:hypothetical protein ACP70R_018497 [Stipagrostis hirtigluma subsp. patula]